MNYEYVRNIELITHDEKPNNPTGCDGGESERQQLLEGFNTLAESINGLYKSEVIWKNYAEVVLATLAWVNWYKNRRVLKSISHIMPVEAEKNVLCFSRE